MTTSDASSAAPNAEGGLSDLTIPPPDPAKLLASWMEWERGDSTPGRIMADLKHGGLPDLLRSLVGTAEA